MGPCPQGLLSTPVAFRPSRKAAQGSETDRNSDALDEARRRALLRLVPPPRRPLSEWIEMHLRLPADVSATPGAVRLWPYQRAIADAIGDPALEWVTLVKSVRVGFTTLLTGALGSFVANEPAPIRPAADRGRLPRLRRQRRGAGLRGHVRAVRANDSPRRGARTASRSCRAASGAAV